MKKITMKLPESGEVLVGAYSDLVEQVQLFINADDEYRFADAETFNIQTLWERRDDAANQLRRHVEWLLI